MIRPLVLRLFGILVTIACATASAAAQDAVAAVAAGAAAPPVKNHVLDPSTFALIGLGLVGLAVFRRRSQGSDKG